MMKSQLNVHILLEKSKTSKLTTSAKKISAMCSRKEQSQLIPQLKVYHVNQCILQENKVSTSKQEYEANVYMEDDKNCQVNMWPVKPAVCDDKKCQSTKFYKNPVCPDKNCHDTMVIQPVQPANKKSCYKQSMPRPAKLQSDCKKKDQVKFNQVFMSDDKNCQSTVCSDINCQSTQCVHMWTAMKSSNMWLPRPAVPYKHKRLLVTRMSIY